MREKVKLRINSDTLAGVLFFLNKKAKHKTVVFLNGSGGTKERFFEIAKSLTKEGYASFCFDFRGRGESQTKEIPPLSFQLKDAQKTINHITSLPFVDPKDITLIATSMGGYIASCIANIHPEIKRIILIAPALFLPKWEKKKYTETTVRDFKKKFISQTRAIKEIKKFKGELFVIFLSRDKTIPDWICQAYLDNGISAKKKIKIEIDSEHAIFRTKPGQQKAKKLLEKILVI
jgi:esterase/lipase